MRIKGSSPEAIQRKREYTKRWRIENPGKVLEAGRKWRDRNLEKVRAHGRAFLAANREKRRQQNREERARNAARIRETNRQYREANRELLALTERVRRYGITGAKYLAMREAQSGLCAVCRGPFSSNGKHIHVDHDHATGKVRGILCRDCNLALGNAKDSIERLEALIAYLRKHAS